MLLSRWKLMAGVLGVSLGGLAAVTGQCPKADSSKQTRRQADPPAFDIPTLPPAPSAGNATTKTPSAPALPAAPSVDLPPPPPVADLPSLPAPVKTPELPKPVDAPKPSATPPAPSSPVVPASGSDVKPLLPPPGPAPVDPGVKPTPPVASPAPDIFATIPASPTKVNPPAADPVIESPLVKPPVIDTPSATKAVTSKYRILLRVGEGDPSFEVKCGDELVLKVVCEKIDIKSPEKGNGPSAVKASGKVRFVGFGAEGTCEELSFLAGTGEVGMAGAVKIQVKDKLGRVESELTTETMKYKIDPSAAFTGGKP